MDLTTTYLGIELENPFLVGASPLTDSREGARRCEDAGAAALVMRSLFEEQVTAEIMATHDATESHVEAFGEALSYMPDPQGFRLGPQEYLERLRIIKDAVSIPVIGSLNGYTPGGWLEWAKSIEQAGADALELNLYHVAADALESSLDIEDRDLEIVRSIRSQIQIPIAVKLSPFFTSLANFGKRLHAAGADGLVLFNRFFEPDIDADELELVSQLRLSTPAELLLRLRWLAILSAEIDDCSFAATGGVHTTRDAVKAAMAGADAIQLVSALLLHGPTRLAQIRRELEQWLEEQEYTSFRQLCGNMNRRRVPDPEALERGNYMHMLQTWQAPV